MPRLAVYLFAFMCFSVAHVQADERRVELFAAAADGQIDVELTAPSAREVWLRVTNKTNEQLRIDLPDAFAAVPVLGQLAPQGNLGLGMPAGGFGNNLGIGQNIGNFGNAPGGLGQGGQGMGSQGLGGGFNNGGNGIGNGVGNIGGGNGMFNPLGNGAQMRGMFRVPAGHTGKVRAATVCLEHGKPEPNSRMRYRIVPIAEFNSDPRIAYLCRMLADREITQNVAQAAAWHIANGLSWEELAAKDRVRSKYSGNQKFFNRDELQQSMRVVELSGGSSYRGEAESAENLRISSADFRASRSAAR
ncbi:MAG: hypothetical protein ACTHK7_04130 [Aureliella sp.]